MRYKYIFCCSKLRGHWQIEIEGGGGEATASHNIYQEGGNMRWWYLFYRFMEMSISLFVKYNEIANWMSSSRIFILGRRCQQGRRSSIPVAYRLFQGRRNKIRQWRYRNATGVALTAAALLPIAVQGIVWAESLRDLQPLLSSRYAY